MDVFQKGSAHYVFSKEDYAFKCRKKQIDSQLINFLCLLAWLQWLLLTYSGHAPTYILFILD